MQMIQKHIKQPVLCIAFVIVVTILVGLLRGHPTEAIPGACSSGTGGQADVSIEDNCVRSMYYAARDSGYSGNIAKFQDAVRSCESYDANGDIGRTSYTETGSCANVIASCYSTAMDQGVCGHNEFLYGILVHDHDGNDVSSEDIDNGILYSHCSSMWDTPAFYLSLSCPSYANTSEGNAMTNEQKKQKELDDYTAEIRDKCAAMHTDDGKFDECVREVMSVYNNCRAAQDNADIHKKVNFTTLRTCSASDSTVNKWLPGSCEASGGTWVPAGTPRDGNTGQVSSVGECTPSAAANPCEGRGDGKLGADGKCSDGSDPNEADCLKAADGKTCLSGITGATNKCGEAKTNIIGCSGTSEGALNDVLRIFVIVLSFGVGIAAVASIAYSAIRYAGARDNQGDVSLARERIRNTVIGLLLYGFLIAIANWLVPGGIL